MDKSLAVFRESCFSLHSCFWLKMQKSTVSEKKDVDCIFDLFEVQVVTVWSRQLGKTPNTCSFAYGRFFTHKIEIFEIFGRFLKIIRSTCQNN